MYNYYPQQAAMRNAQTPFPLKGHFVSSFEEAKVANVDFDGSIFFFPDIANKKIYTKAIGMDGVAQLNMYELKPIPADPTPEEYVTRTEFSQTLEALMQKLSPTVKEEKTTDKQYKEVF